VFGRTDGAGFARGLGDRFPRGTVLYHLVVEPLDTHPVAAAELGLLADVTPRVFTRRPLNVIAGGAAKDLSGHRRVRVAVDLIAGVVNPEPLQRLVIVGGPRECARLDLGEVDDGQGHA